MNPQQIKANAPQGASHTIESFGKLDYLKFDGRDWYIYIEYQNHPGEWILTCYNRILSEFKNTIKPL